VWFDRSNLNGNHKLNDEISTRLERAASFVAVLSPRYLASQWRQDEACMFAHACGGDPGRRLFIVEKAPLDGEFGPPGFAGRTRAWSSRGASPGGLARRSAQC
jgi:TIR domain